MRLFLIATIAVSLLLAAGEARAAPISCSEIPQAQQFVDGLKPGPNTRAAQRHLDAARHAASAGQCSAELRQVDIYARRSAAADKRLAAGGRPVRHAGRRCADFLHEDRPGGTDYHGPPVPGC